MKPLILMNYKRLFLPNSLIFITVVTHHRKPLLTTHITTLRQAFKIAQKKYPFTILAIIVNPDHFHLIIKPIDIHTYPKILGMIKSFITKLSGLGYTLNKNRESSVWQRRYWEHIIRNEEDLYKHIDYIHYNSIKHADISPKDWPYSSFQRFVQKGWYDLNWCNKTDKYHIKQLNME